MHPNERVIKIFEDAFPAVLNEPRRVGIEEEFVVIDKEGNPGNVPAIFSLLAKDGWKEKRDPVTGALVGVENPEAEVSTDVGQGILEVGFAPAKNLNLHNNARGELLGLLDTELQKLGMRRLCDYAVQPKVLPVRDHWVKKARALYFRDLFSRDVDVQTASAASQCHVEITRKEIVPATVTLIALAPVLIALTANSPVWAGRLDAQRKLAARQAFWRRFTVGYGYDGNIAPDSEPTDLAELIDKIVSAQFIVHVSGSDIIAPGIPFKDWLHANPATDDSALRDALASHMGTLWWDARPRQIYGTVEVRPCCQNKDALAHHAFILGLVENMETARQYVSHMRFSAWRELVYEAETIGLQHKFLREAAGWLYTVAREGLLRRGFDEERFLVPLDQRIEMHASPGQAKRALFEEKGFEPFLASLF